MKKKIINGFLMVALLAATVTSFVSCKDNDEDVKYDLLNELRGDITPVQTAITNAQNDATQAIQDAADAATAAANAQTSANNAQTTADDAKTKAQQALDWINAQDLSVYMKKEDFKDSIAHYLQDWALESEVASRFSAVWDELQKQDAKIKADSIRIDSLAGVTTSIKTDVENIKTDIATIKEDVAKVQKDISNIIETLTNLITSVTVNATSNSLLANSKIFPGLNVQFVGAAFGQAVTSSGEFPSTEADLNGNKLNADYINITEGEKYEWDNNIINNKENNAGKIYFTVNPSNVTENILSKNVVFSLTNSQNNRDNDGEPIVTLANVKKSNKVLTWGTTRGESQVTLFEADATYDLTKANAIDPTKMIDFNSIKNNFVNIINAAKSITRENDQFKETTSAAAKTTIQETAKAVATLLNAKIPHLPALALKAEWKDTVGTRNVISDYSLAATAYKPLSFNFGKEVGDGLPTISLNKIDNAVFNFAKKFKNTIDEFKAKVGETNFNFSFNLSGLDPSKFNVKKTIYVIVRTGEKTAKDADNKDVNVVTIENISFSEKEADIEGATKITSKSTDFKANKTYYNEVTVGEDLTDQIKTIKDAVNKGVDTSDIENLLADAVKALDNVNKSIDNVTDLVDLTTNYLESIVNGAINFVNKGGIARALEPVLLANTKDGIVRATGSYEAGEFTFVPTTMTYEIVAPAFKKYIAIVDKTGKARFGKVLTKGDNDFSAVKLTLQQDDVKLIYAAMDFTGRQIIKEYDITVE